MKSVFYIIVVTGILFFTACKQTKIENPDYLIQPVPFTSVKMTDSFWAPRIYTNHKVTIPIAFKQSEETGRIENFKIAGGLKEGEFCSKYPFDDSDVFKIIEGASFSLQTNPDSELEAYLDSLIAHIASAQEEDGYLYTYRTIMGDNSHPWIGGRRWEKTHLLSHELYNIGHMYEAAAAHYLATGKRSLLDVAIKSADLVCEDFGWGKFESYPGHQEIELGLVKLYRITGDQKYLDLAKFFLDVRGDGDTYSQAHKPVIEQTVAVGHAVRATYMYSAMADVAALTNDQSYIDAITKIWENVVYTQIYITGGIGATGGNEGFSEPFELPNISAYCETCASIANVFWNYRMFLHEGNVKYFDVLERTLYNGLLSGVSLTGDRFFYPNPLASMGQHKRQKWFGCACCPSNISRFLPSFPGYIYATSEEKIYVNLYASNETELDFFGDAIKMVMKTLYPWDGHVDIEIDPGKRKRFTLMLRIPGWARNKAIPGNLYNFRQENDQPVEISINGEMLVADAAEGYIQINRKWKKGDHISLNLPMPVRQIMAHEKIKYDKGRFAIQRGPLVYCLEEQDQPGQRVFNLQGNMEGVFSSEYDDNMLNGIQKIKFEGISYLEDKKGALQFQPVTITAIPYYVWANRKQGEMMVWIPFEEQAVEENMAIPLYE